MTKYNFKIATEEDKGWLMTMCQSFFSFSEYSQIRSPDLSKIEETVDWYLSRPKNEAIVFLMTYEGIPVGMISLMNAPTPFWDGFLASEQTWWVDPDHRGRESLRMLDLAEEWAKKTGCIGLALSALSTNQKVTKIYERRGYKLSELAYFKGF